MKPLVVGPLPNLSYAGPRTARLAVGADIVATGASAAGAAATDGSAENVRRSPVAGAVATTGAGEAIVIGLA